VRNKNTPNIAIAEQDRQVGPATVSIEDDPQRQQRVPDPPLHEHECDQQHHAERQQADRQRGAPAVGLGLREPVDQRHQAGYDERRPRPIEMHLGVARLVDQQPHGAQQRDTGKPHVDVQAPAPAQVLGQDPAKQQPHGPTGTGDRAVDPERLTAL
jgi:hypothetical protein